MNISAKLSNNIAKPIKNKAFSVTNSVQEHCSKPDKNFKMSAARINLEMQAEMMDPDDYIRIRSYLDQQERHLY
ncbi:hypothetical protein HDR58_10790 [bacterium]|nr:hypothetical protein [bacterium]